MSDFLGHPYNYTAYERRPAESAHFRTVTHAGDPAPDFELPSLAGGTVRLASHRGSPVMIEFGSIT